MSLIWIFFSLSFYIFYNTTKKKGIQSVANTNKPLISILIPCFNEERDISKTISTLIDEIEYPNYEIIVINDGSKDHTLDTLIVLANKFNLVRVCNVERNLGKAHALTQGAIFSRAEFLLCLDADATIEKNSLNIMVNNFLGKENYLVGAVTGNPIVKNRTTFIGKIQTVEFLSIIGLIKRAQMTFGTLNTVSGVCVMFRKTALWDVGWWDQECITEDIAVTWRLQKNGWKIIFEPDAICWMLVPEKLKNLFKQRLRWSQGGIEVLLKNVDVFIGKKFCFGLSILYIEQIFSILWSVLWYSFLPIILAKFFVFNETSFVSIVLSVILVLAAIMQYFFSILLNIKYDTKIIKTSFFAVWYILVYWIVNPITLLIGIPLAIKSHLKGGQAIWESPDRGKYNNEN